MTARQILISNLNNALDFYSDLGKAQLLSQGHNASGKLYQSFENKITSTLNGIVTGQILVEEYGRYLDTGVDAANVKYSPYVLLPWIQIIAPSLSAGEQVSFAFAIKKTHEKTGIPSPGSYSFTANGFRKSWIERGFSQENEFEKLLGLDRFVRGIINDLTSKIEA